MRGKQIDIKWYTSDFTNSTKLKITVIYNMFKGTFIEIEKLCDLIYNSKKDTVKYVYVIYNSDSKMYEVILSMVKPMKDFAKARLRQSLSIWNPECDYKVENNKMTVKELEEYISSRYTQNNTRVHVIKQGNIKIKHTSKSPLDSLRDKVIHVMNKIGIKLKYMSNIIVDCNYKQISIVDTINILREDPILSGYSIKELCKISDELELNNKFEKQVLRSMYPVYRPARRYLEFSDCIFDVFTCKQLSKQQPLFETINKTHSVEVHPCYKFEHTFLHYLKNMPYNHCVQVARIMSPDIFEWCIQKITQRITPQKNVVVLSGPSHIGKSLIFKPIFDIYKNVTINDFNDFSLNNYTSEELVFCDNINICLKYNKNQLFKDDAMTSTILDGKTYGNSGEGNGKIVFSITKEGIYYINDKYGTRMLIIELSNKIPKCIDEELEDINEDSGCSIILNLLLNTQTIKDFIHSQRIDNNWATDVYVNGKMYKNNQIVYEPENYTYAFNYDRYENYKELKYRL